MAALNFTQNCKSITSLPARFWAKVHKTNSCWPWTANCDRKGYGTIQITADGKRRPYLASRISYWLHYGAIPDGANVCHKCDNPLCVRPDHLFLGSQKDNIQDMLKKGRRRPFACSVRGERNGQAKLTAGTVRAIRKLAVEGVHPNEIAPLFNIHPVNAKAVINRKTWKHVE